MKYLRSCKAAPGSEGSAGEKVQKVQRVQRVLVAPLRGRLYRKVVFASLKGATAALGR